MGKLIPQRETRVRRTYQGGALLDAFLGKETCTDGFTPEDWISSFIEAKNRDYIPGEGISQAWDGTPITDLVDTGANVLIKLLDSSERLGIQVHPTDAYAKELFDAPCGKTECWHVLDTRTIGGEIPKIYLGLKPQITRQLWEAYYRTQDVAAMLEGMNQIPVKPGDTILVKGGMAHAIGGGCLILEIQQPSDYTMRCETTPLSGAPYTPMQIHYGAGEEAMLNCFDYRPQTREALEASCLLQPAYRQLDGAVCQELVTYADTPCFALSKLTCQHYHLLDDRCLTLICLEDGGSLSAEGDTYPLKRGDRFFALGQTDILCQDCRLLVCYPPKE